MLQEEEEEKNEEEEEDDDILDAVLWFVHLLFIRLSPTMSTTLWSCLKSILRMKMTTLTSSPLYSSPTAYYV